MLYLRDIQGTQSPGDTKSWQAISNLLPVCPPMTHQSAHYSHYDFGLNNHLPTSMSTLPNPMSFKMMSRTVSEAKEQVEFLEGEPLHTE
jgi:hypothetical protein